MRVLAIDPGYDRMGVAVLEKINDKETVVYSTCLLTDKKAGLNDRIFYLGEELNKVFIEYKPEVFGIETLFFNKNTKTALGVAEVRGVAIYIANKNHAQVSEHSPQAVKLAITGYGKSDKTAVISMVKMLVKNVPNNALDDEYDAIAVGVTCLAHQR
jgi:crossover junction endodeoxyribonuclease RuvC